jgi:hypothetical protein
MRFRAHWPSLILFGLVIEFGTIMVLLHIPLIVGLFQKVNNGWWQLTMTPLHQAAYLVLGLTTWTVIWCTFVWFVMPIAVRTDGLSGWTAYSMPAKCQWADIVRIETKSLFGMYYGRIITTKGPSISIFSRMWLSDPNGFADAVAAAAGEDHLLTKWLREEWEYLDS